MLYKGFAVLLVIVALSAIAVYLWRNPPASAELPVSPPVVAVRKFDDVFLERLSFKKEDVQQWQLPMKLKEISGLALTQDGRIFAHDDERGTLYAIDEKTGEIRKRFSLGERTARADFEGIAIVEDDIYLVTSGGTIYLTHEGNDRQKVEYQQFPTDLVDICEVEGLTYEPDSRLLMMVCKVVFKASDRDSILVYGWSPETRELSSPLIKIAADELLPRIDKRGFNPSGIEYVDELKRLLIVAAEQHLILELTMDGEIVALQKLSMKRHPQTEGVAVLKDGSLILADEGRNRATLSIYKPIAATEADRP